MLLRLSPDAKRARAITNRYFNVDTEVVYSVGKAYLAFNAASIEEITSKTGIVSCLITSPAITPLGENGTLIVGTHPAISRGTLLVAPDDCVKEGTMSFKVKASKEELEALPYHFKVGVMPHSRMAD